MPIASKFSVLIIGYRRSENIAKQLELSRLAGAERIYVAIDAANNLDTVAQKDVERAQAVVRNFDDAYPHLIRYRFRQLNAGCSASVLSAIQWIFENEELAIILEDDCIPGDDFFAFVADKSTLLKNTPSLWMLSGTQFFPNKSSKYCSLSKYPMIWGWATNHQKWQEMNSAMRAELGSAPRPSWSEFTEFHYWKSGARRSRLGYVDTWDTLLAFWMFALRKTALLPDQNLVKNVGYDMAASHTFRADEWLDRNIGNYLSDMAHPTANPTNDALLKDDFYRISFRHNFSTRLNHLADLLLRRKKYSNLIGRWDKAKTGPFIP